MVIGESKDCIFAAMKNKTGNKEELRRLTIFSSLEQEGTKILV